jgi:hypothetical protein
MTIAHSAAHKASADAYIHACLRKIVFINRSLTLIMAESVAAEHHERGAGGADKINFWLRITRGGSQNERSAACRGAIG